MKNTLQSVNGLQQREHQPPSIPYVSLYSQTILHTKINKANIYNYTSLFQYISLTHTRTFARIYVLTTTLLNLKCKDM